MTYREEVVPVFLYTVAVGFTTHRPVRPDERTHVIKFWAESDHDARITAAHWIDARPGVEMVTRTTILEVEL